MAAKTELKKTVTKVVLCNVTREPIAVVQVPAGTRTIDIASAYSKCGDAVNVNSHKVSADKRIAKKAAECGAYRTTAQLDEKTKTYSLT